MVSIITINYNGWQDTCELLTSLKEYETYPYEVIVVDNASLGDDVERIMTCHPEAKIVRSENNLGFAGGNNLGYKESKGEYIFFLNNDTVIKTPVLEALVRRLKSPEIGGVSPMICSYYPPYNLQYYGYQKLTPITLRHCTPYDSLHLEKYFADREIEVMHGAAMMLPRKVFNEVGRMAECYFLYFEEFDLSYKVLNHGYRIWYDPSVLIYHKEGTKKGKGLVPFREYYLVRGRILFARRFLSGVNKVLSLCFLLGVVSSRNIFKYLLQGRWKSIKAVLQGVISGLFSSKY